ncbi:hypothetical protein RUMGNA_01698 [Mediterraneibacter gnavus ATCC 29149]|uniref:Uncharacterized protein n=1 Tax=Mediterraneibacter gnavus (strain ATCC 29149 / DSM 114966 / JCM 6515 / VPI C7-9) TaxID=411470 RepID=A7B2C0_MEDG7|nr:hypothetical protein RUMGNA_01698 [Mediterraneibacter gnavus ATCC 29149]
MYTGNISERNPFQLYLNRQQPAFRIFPVKKQEKANGKPERGLSSKN